MTRPWWRGLTWPAGAGLAVVLGYACVAHPGMAVLLGAAVAAVVGLAVAGPQAFPLAVVLVAVAPWYPFLSTEAMGPLVPDAALCLAVLGAPIGPWLWSLRRGLTSRRPSAAVGLFGLLCVCLLASVASAVGPKALIGPPIVAAGAGGLVFVGARRFPDARAWGAAATVGVVLLVGMGAVAAFAQPTERVGGFSGYPITYGALLVTLLPPALAWTGHRSRWLAGLVGTSAVVLMILSQSRSSWIAGTVVGLVLVLLLLRQGRWRELAMCLLVVVAASTAIAASGSLGRLVERKLAPDVRQTDAVTHRAWSYGYAVDRIVQHPAFGAGAPGFAAEESSEQTGIGALDNGYLSVAVDTGVLGLLTVMVPIALVLGSLGGWLRRGTVPPAATQALAFGVLGLAIVTIFYDVFYWAQLSLLLFAMGGALSADGARRAAQPAVVRRSRAGRSSRRLLLAGSEA